MDTLTPLLILAAKRAAEERERQDGTSLIIGSVWTAMGMPVIGAMVGSPVLSGVASACASWVGLKSLLFNASETASKVGKETKAKGKNKAPDHAASTIDPRIVEAVVERVKAELPTLLETLNSTPSRAIVSETYDTVYRSQIAAAQEFLNENRSADLSRVKCLLHKLLPKEYFEYVEQLREHQDPQTIINIMGGQNIVAPNAQEASQSFHGEKKPKKGS